MFLRFLVAESWCLETVRHEECWNERSAVDSKIRSGQVVWQRRVSGVAVRSGRATAYSAYRSSPSNGEAFYAGEFRTILRRMPITDRKGKPYAVAVGNLRIKLHVLFHRGTVPRLSADGRCWAG